MKAPLLAAVLTLAAATTVFAQSSADQQPSSKPDRHTEEQPITDSLNLLQSRGFGDYRDFRAVGGHYEATVDDNGKPTTVIIDPAAGTLKRGN